MNKSYVEIEKGVKSIGKNAFFICEKLTSIIVPSSVTSMGSGVFYGCTDLTIYCEAQSKPSGWDSGWNSYKCPVVWGHK